MPAALNDLGRICSPYDPKLDRHTELAESLQAELDDYNLTCTIVKLGRSHPQWWYGDDCSCGRHGEGYRVIFRYKKHTPVFSFIFWNAAGHTTTPTLVEVVKIIAANATNYGTFDNYRASFGILNGQAAKRRYLLIKTFRTKLINFFGADLLRRFTAKCDAKG